MLEREWHEMAKTKLTDKIAEQVAALERAQKARRAANSMESQIRAIKSLADTIKRGKT